MEEQNTYGDKPRDRAAYWKKLADSAAKAGTMPKHCRAAARDLGGQIARLEQSIEGLYARQEEGRSATVGAVEQMGRAKKHLADLKGRFYQLTGLDRMHLAKVLQLEGQGKGAQAVVLDVPGVQPPPLQDEEDY